MRGGVTVPTCSSLRTIHVPVALPKTSEASVRVHHYLSPFSRVSERAVARSVCFAFAYHAGKPRRGLVSELDCFSGHARCVGLCGLGIVDPS